MSNSGDPPGTGHGVAGARGRIDEEIEYYFNLAKRSGDKRVGRAARWHLTEIGLTVGAALLATASAATVLGSDQYRLVAGFLALGAALTSSLTAALAPAEKRQRNLRLATNYLRVADDARLLRAADLPYMGREQARDALQAVITAYQNAQTAMVSAEAESAGRSRVPAPEQ